MNSFFNLLERLQPLFQICSKILDAHPPPQSNFFIFMQLLGNFVQIIGLHPPFGIGAPLGNSGSIPGGHLIVSKMFSQIFYALLHVHLF